MKAFIRPTLFTFLAAIVLFSSCGIKDDKPPRIYLTGSNDTVVIMREKYIDPGYFAEDNVSKTENLILEDNLEAQISVTADGYTNRNEVYEITYTATDEEGNSRSVVRTVRVQNISTPYAGSYTVYRRNSLFWGDTTYRSTIAVDTRVSGRLRISRVYNHWDPTFGAQVYFRINADLWAPDLVTSVPHFDNANNNSGVGFMGLSNTNNSVPWYRNMGYEEAQQTRRFEYIHIPNQVWKDSLENASFTILGSTQSTPVNGVYYPKSRIEYLGGDIRKITLEYSITNLATGVNDQVKEEYTPLED